MEKCTSIGGCVSHGFRGRFGLRAVQVVGDKSRLKMTGDPELILSKISRSSHSIAAEASNEL